jgi:integrase
MVNMADEATLVVLDSLKIYTSRSYAHWIEPGCQFTTMASCGDNPTPTLRYEVGYDIRTVQELLGHNDVKTTMIYTQVLCPQLRTGRRAQSGRRSVRQDWEIIMPIRLKPHDKLRAREQVAKDQELRA